MISRFGIVCLKLFTYSVKASLVLLRFKTGKFRTIADEPVNLGLGALQMSAAKMNGKRADRSTDAAFGLGCKTLLHKLGYVYWLIVPSRVRSGRFVGMPLIDNSHRG